MKYKRPLIFLLPLYIVLMYFDYVNYNQFKWFENIIQTLCIVIFFEIGMWLLTTKKTTSRK
ncbi:hypothetical protein QUF99_01675 [Bacillus sp. DX4.1]|uniref:hypothetical protein n=1 Tax=Bacillus sp. DX4.1 TaxID=3055867 RepID=UPI0025A02195|nr:hypothetical protein [Bacillus sp. DX4.1]MDM5186175.1 hypothetical protein [Bacillus sp. DX4.1]